MDKNSNLQNLISRLEGVKTTGQNQWSAFCPCHENPPDGHSPSLGISCTEDGRVLLKCRGGCDTKDVLAAIGLSLADLFPGPQVGCTPQTNVTYEYQQADGTPYTRTVRVSPKGFYQQRYEVGGNGGAWVNGLNGRKPILFRLPELLASDPDKLIFIGEGEKDVDRLFREGLTATTNPGGAGKWKPYYSEHLKGRRVVILPDNDKAGREHAREVARHLQNTAAEVKVLNLPGLPGKGDVSDWLNNGGTCEKLINLAEQTPVWNPTPTKGPIDGELPACTEAANGQLFADQNQGEAYWCDPWRTWLVRTDVCLRKDGAKNVDKRAVQTLGSLLAEADDLGDKKLFGWAKRSLSDRGIRAMLERAKHHLAIEPDKLDRDPMLLNCRNGIYDLTAGEFRKRQPTDLITQVTGAAYDPDAECPLWTEFLDRIMNGNGELIAYLQTVMGLCLTGDIAEQIFVIFYGIGANGKSVFTDTMMGVLGDYAAKAPSALLEVRHNDEHPTAIASLFRKRLVIASEMEESRKLRVQLVKELTGDRTIKARLMRQDYFDFERTHKIILVTNHKPIIRDSSIAIWRRVRLIPFDVCIPPVDQDPKLLEKLRAEWPGILNWAIEGCRRWIDKGLHTPDIVKANTEQYEVEMDPLAEFIADRCILDAASADTVGRIKAEYADWADKNGERYKLNRNEFKARLEHQGCEQILGPDPISGKKSRLWKGIRLKTTPPPKEAEPEMAWPDEAKGGGVPF